MANGELIDARSAMDMLGIGENELQTLVARGDLRAFRSAGTMKFRRDDVMGLKSEKGTEPTIIIPAAGQRKPGQSGILSAAQAGPAGSGIRQGAPAARGGAPASATEHAAPVTKASDATGEIVFDDIELMPTDDGMATQEATVVSSAIQTSVGGDAATIVDQTSVGQEATGEMTVVESDSSADEAKVSTGPAVPVQATASGNRPGVRPISRIGSRVGSAVGPAVSRVRQQSVATPRRTATVYEVKTAHPIMTVILLLNAGVLLFTGSIFGVMEFKGHVYIDDPDHPRVVERLIPPYLRELEIYKQNFYGHWFGSLPGCPMDPKPEGEADPGEGGTVRPQLDPNANADGENKDEKAPPPAS